MNEEFITALKEIVKDKGISEDLIFTTIEDAMVAAYKKNYANNVTAAQNVRVSIDRETGEIHVYAQKVVCEEVYDEVKAEFVKRGAYILKDCEGTPEVILIATGSEVQLAVSAAEALAGKGRKARVVSMPCAELFDAQPAEYKENVLPRAVRARVAVEAASVDGWWKYVGLDGAVVGMSGFGESAPGDVLFKHFGFTVDHVVDVAEGLLK